MSTYPPSHHASQTSLLPPFDQLEGQHRYDVCVIGAGYTGLSTALHLQKLGYQVCLLEAERVGSGASGRNGGQLGFAMHDLQPALIARHGEQRARMLWDISVESIDLFHQLSQEYAIDCDFREGNMACAANRSDFENLLAHVRIVEGYGASLYTIYDRNESREVSGSPRYHGAICSERAGHINPLKYTLALAQAAAEAGVTLHEKSPVKEISYSSPTQVHTAMGSITAEHAVLCCNGYLGTLNKTMASRILPIDNYQTATAVLDEASLSKLIDGTMCIWDTSRSVHYFRMTPDNRLIMGCGVGVPGRTPRNIWRDCAQHLEYVYPHMAGVQLDYAWGGTLAVTRSSLPDMGKLADNIWYSQGYNGHGVAMAPMAGKYIAEAIHSSSPQFDLLAQTKHKPVPGGTPLRIAAVLAYRFTTNTLDRLTRNL